MNLTTLIGNLTKDPQEVKMENDKHLCKLTLAVRENYTQNGERPVQYFNVAVWGAMATNCLRYLTKGSKVAVVGKLQTRSWEDNGVKKFAIEIVASEVESLSSPNKITDDEIPE